MAWKHDPESGGSSQIDPLGSVNVYSLLSVYKRYWLELKYWSIGDKFFKNKFFPILGHMTLKCGCDSDTLIDN